MQLRINDSAIRSLEANLASVGRVFTPALMGRIMLEAAAPMLPAIRAEVPVGKRITRGQGRLKRDPKGGGDYDRGGATRRDARLLIVPGNAGEVIRLVAGISKKSGHVGWRTHFITKGSVHNRANDFLGRVESNLLPIVELRVGAAAQTVVSRALARFAR